MNDRSRRLALGAAVALAGWMAGPAQAAPEAATPSPTPTSTSTSRSTPAMTQIVQTAQGAFDVQLTPAPPAPGNEAAKLGRMALRKQFHGPLEATSLGEMLAFRSDTPGSAGYVAMERVEGKLDGRSGSFVLMHLGEMNRGQPRLTVQVVPDSGTGELTGLSGTMTIDASDGKHAYEFRYQMPPR